jgi:quercetin dioxygenase-like cupin family protein
MSNFHRLAEILQDMARKATEGVAAVRPLALGEGVMAGLLCSGPHDLGLHRQPNHEELLVVLEGEGEFRVGDEARPVRPGDFIFVPRDAPHGTVRTTVGPLSFLSIIAPRADLATDLVWDSAPPRFEMV